MRHMNVTQYYVVWIVLVVWTDIAGKLRLMTEQRMLPYCARKPKIEAPAQRWSLLLY